MPELKIEKYPHPVLQPLEKSYWESEQTRNPAAIWHDNKVHLIYTASGDFVRDHLIYLGHATSNDGINFTRCSDEPMIMPSADEFFGFDAGGMEDPRIVKIDDYFYITYMARAVPFLAFHRGVTRDDIPKNAGITWTENARRGGLLRSKDLKTFERMGPITGEHAHEANVILFPEKINGKYVMLHRPSNAAPASNEVEAGISIAFSDDLLNWYDDQPLIMAEQPWEGKIGGSSPPLRTEKGWLMLYHGAEFADESKEWYMPGFVFSYRVGVILLDLKDPTKVIARSKNFIMEPTLCFERWGTVNNVVFPTGTVVKNDILYIYYGGADTVCGLATVAINDLLEYVLSYK